MKVALVIGAGPAGLMAAEELAAAGLQVIVSDAMPSVGRKFLMAGKSGLNLTMDVDQGAFLGAFPTLPPALRTALDGFGPMQVKDWAQGLGQDVFTGSSRRVFPTAMKASPLLRAWLRRLVDAGVTFRLRWRWTGWSGGDAVFDTPEGQQTVAPDVTVLAMGGASWSRLGSNGTWVAQFVDLTAPFQPANVGFMVSWSDHMARHFGSAVKGCALSARGQHVRGEFVVSARGIEGGGVYSVSAAMRDGAELTLDLFPDLGHDDIAQRLARPRGKASLANHLRKVLRLEGVRAALVNEFGRPFPQDMAGLLKALPVAHLGPRPLDEAISTAGGIRFDALDADLMLHTHPGVFCAGEMLDWEAPTGGYLITACLATGRRAGRAAARFT
ncbi:TIGR03862 family flavoprotein [Octadecabacter sp. SW4]|uniref:TIGR03862 family flavoprotein n=1 Tax=Octadecabacter sp. SW4 TaxID=2602067 RepID=UPI0011C1FB65|nr:TIGR03862 family flavoprotein [Octadecabacter sp. SW4]QEE36968.1 TIGR03862 family flavoprotein [Octadecabacter sp. SW4]